jgi:hypothetical protein
MDDYERKLTEYTILFLEKFTNDAQVIDIVKKRFLTVDIHRAEHDVGDGFGLDFFKTIKKDDPALFLSSVHTLLENVPELKFNMMTAMHMAKSLFNDELRILNIFEMLSLRSIILSNIESDNLSARSTIVKALEIPLKYVPKEIIISTSSNDEMLAATTFIEKEIDLCDEPSAFMNIESYREYARSAAEKIILKANEESYFGTYPAYVFAEILMLHKMADTNIPLYSTSTYPKIDVPYDQLTEMTKSIWEKTNKHFHD